METGARDADLKVVAESLDKVFDIFGEDDTDPVFAELRLLPKLAQILLGKGLGESFAVVAMAKTDLQRFIKYREKKPLLWSELIENHDVLDDFTSRSDGACSLPSHFLKTSTSVTSSSVSSAVTSRRIPSSPQKLTVIRGGQFELSEPPCSLTPSGMSGQDSVGGDQSAPLSLISETDMDIRKTTGSGSDARSVSAAVSDKPVAGDSDVFEAPHKRDDLGISMNLETAQVQIKLRYSNTDNLLHVGIERARNLAALFIPENRKVYVV